MTTHYLSLVTETLRRLIDHSSQDVLLTDREVSVQLLTRLAVQDMNDARVHIQNLPPPTFDIPWTFKYWLLERYRKRTIEEPTKMKTRNWLT